MTTTIQFLRGSGTPSYPLLPAQPGWDDAGHALWMGSRSGNVCVVGSGTVTSGRIGNGAVGSGNVASGGLGAIHLHSGSITQSVEGFSGSLVTTGSTTYIDLDKKTINTTGGNVLLVWRADVYANAGGSTEQLRMLGNSGVLGADPAADFAFSAGGDVTGGSLVYLDTPASGTWTYTVQIKAGAGSGLINARNRSLALVELKR